MTTYAPAYGSDGRLRIGISTSGLLYFFCCTTFLLFALRDGLTGSIRYYLDMYGLALLWFVPDGLAFISVLLFAWCVIVPRKNIPGIYILALLFFSTCVSVFFMNDQLFSLFSSVKMFIPMFVGFCFFGRSVTETRFMRVCILILFLVSALGLALNPYFDYPWVGQSIDNFGVEKVAGKLWWIEGKIRYGGLAGDSTMAAFMTMFPYFLIAPYMSLLVNIMFWPLIIWALETSTSRTAELTFAVFVIVYLASYVMRFGPSWTERLRTWAKLSFICILIPFILILFLGGTDPAEMPRSMYSLVDRINNSWQLPYIYIGDLFPIGTLIGCGLGCFVYPMDYTNYAMYNVPVDNFYLTNFLMMGVFFVPFVLMQINAVGFAKDHTKLGLIIVFNVYCITIQCYGPSYATLMFGYIFSEMFRHNHAHRERRIDPRLGYTPKAWKPANLQPKPSKLRSL